MEKRKIQILGTEYELLLKDEEEDKAFEQCGGYRDAYAKQIVVNNFKPDPDILTETKNLQAAVKQNIRHEIIHAFMYESGLDCNSMHYEGAWAKSEEMTDWFAIQGPKIYEAWKKADAI